MTNAIITWTGKRVDPLNVRPEDLDIVDIAHSLSLTCRYNGHTAGHLSVAAHSIAVSQWLADKPDLIQLWGLLHDASEAYLGDMVAPLKHRMPEFLAAELAFDEVLAERYSLPWPRPEIIKTADHEIARVEAEKRTTYYGNAEQDESVFLQVFNKLCPEEAEAAAKADPNHIDPNYVDASIVLGR